MTNGKAIYRILLKNSEQAWRGGGGLALWGRRSTTGKEEKEEGFIYNQQVTEGP